MIRVPMSHGLQMEIEDYFQEHNVFKNGLSGRPCHCDSYMTVVDFENLEKALCADYNWYAFAELIKMDSNSQIPMRIVVRYIESDLFE